MPKTNERITVAIELSYDSKKEDRAGALAATFAAMAEGIANGKTAGPLPNRGSWTIRNGTEIVKR